LQKKLGLNYDISNQHDLLIEEKQEGKSTSRRFPHNAAILLSDRFRKLGHT